MQSVLIYLPCIILLFETTSVSTDGNCGSSFKGKCWCGVSDYDRIQQYIVNCTNEGFSSTAVLEHMPAEVNFENTIIHQPNLVLSNIIKVVFDIERRFLSTGASSHFHRECTNHLTLEYFR